MMRLHEVLARARNLGMTVSFNNGDYRVAYPLFQHYARLYPLKSHGYWRERQEVDAYYTDDALDAYSTAIVMSKALVREAA